MTVKILLQLLVGKIDIKLFKPVDFKVFKTEDVKDTNRTERRAAVPESYVDPLENPTKQTGVQRHGHGIT